MDKAGAGTDCFCLLIVEMDPDGLWPVSPQLANRDFSSPKHGQAGASMNKNRLFLFVGSWELDPYD